MQPISRKRRGPRGPSKNELRAARHERAELEKARTGTLSQRFPEVLRLEMDLRLESPAGAPWDHTQVRLEADDAVTLDISCPGCGGGRFLLEGAIQNLLSSKAERRDGLAICEAPSLGDPRMPCGVKLNYQITITYKGE
jgi:hypothetical protein